MPHAFNLCHLEINSNSELKQEHQESSPQPLKTLYLHYHNAYGHQTWQGGDLPQRAPTHKVTRPCDHVVFLKPRVKLKTYLHYQSAYGHRN